MNAERLAVADELARALESPLLRALTEPSRLELLKVLILHGPADVGTLADHLPQERSVVSRHLHVLLAAGIARSTRDGRRRVYEIDGQALLRQFEPLLSQSRALAALCCPAEET
jgi:DNA-binding transcriptional ArsR family regulator